MNITQTGESPAAQSESTPRLQEHSTSQGAGPKCKYANSKLNFSCERLDEGHARCSFHDADRVIYAIDSLQKDLERLLRDGDGHWQGFFLAEEVVFTALVVEHELDLRFGDIKALTFRRCVFKKEVNISGSKFHDDVDFEGCIFEGEFIAETVKFDGEFRWSSTANSRVTFEGSKFSQRAKFVGEFNGPAFFNRVTFCDVTDFIGGWHIVAIFGSRVKPPPAKPKRVFNAGAHLEQIDFRRPERVQFRMVDLRKVYTGDTDFRRVRFYNTLWFQQALGRSGLFHEVDAASDPTAPKRYGALWEANYRNIRIALEDSKDFNASMDFYIGEMEWRRRQLPGWRRMFFSVEAMYRYLSNYGGSPGRAFCLLVGLIAVYAIVTGVTLGTACFDISPSCTPDPALLTRAVALVDILKVTVSLDPLPGWGPVLEGIFKVFILVQIALFVLALRNRIKRG